MWGLPGKELRLPSGEGKGLFSGQESDRQGLPKV